MSVSAGEKLAWKAGDKGTQGFWHEWPDKIYDGPIGFTLKEIGSTPDGFTFRAYNVYADCATRRRGCRRAERHPAGRHGRHAADAFRAGVPHDKLPKMTRQRAAVPPPGRNLRCQ